MPETTWKEIKVKAHIKDTISIEQKFDIRENGSEACRIIKELRMLNPDCNYKFNDPEYVDKLYEYAATHQGSQVKKDPWTGVYTLYSEQTWYVHKLIIEYSVNGVTFEKTVTYDYEDDTLGQDFLYVTCDVDQPENIHFLSITDDDSFFMPMIALMLFVTIFCIFMVAWFFNSK